MIEQLGPMITYSCRCLERSIGLCKKLIKSRLRTGANAGNVIFRLAVQSYLKQLEWTPEDEVALITTRKHTGYAFINPFLENQSGYQLWEPYCNIDVNRQDEYHSIPLMKLKQSLVRYCTRSNRHDHIVIDCPEIQIAGRCWSAPNYVYSSEIYRQKSNKFTRGNHIVMFGSPHLR